MEKLILAARDIYIYGLPLIVSEMVHQDYGDTKIIHFRQFPTIENSPFGKPNCDTLYSIGFVQLAKTPYVLHIPKVEDRFFLFPIYDAYMNVVQSLGTRTNQWGEFILLYQNEEVPEGYEGCQVLRFSHSLNGALMRVEAMGEQDYPYVNRLQDGVILEPVYPERLTPLQKSDGTNPNIRALRLSEKEFYEQFSQLIADNPVVDLKILEQAKYFGIGKRFDFGGISEEKQEALRKGKELAIQLLAGQNTMAEVIAVFQNWSAVLKGLGEFGENYLLRAQVAAAPGGWGTNVAADSVYVVTDRDSSQNPLERDKQYRIHFDADGLPHAGAFWSVALYGAESGAVSSHESGRYSFNSNDLKTGRIAVNRDGSLDIYIGKTKPEHVEIEKNWIPAVFEDTVMNVTIRIYGPDAYTLEGNWTPPRIDAI